MRAASSAQAIHASANSSNIALSFAAAFCASLRQSAAYWRNFSTSSIGALAQCSFVARNGTGEQSPKFLIKKCGGNGTKRDLPNFAPVVMRPGAGNRASCQRRNTIGTMPPNACGSPAKPTMSRKKTCCYGWPSIGGNWQSARKSKKTGTGRLPNLDQIRRRHRRERGSSMETLMTQSAHVATTKVSRRAGNSAA